MTEIKWYQFTFSMKKGNIAKYKPILDYISKNYYPEFLSIAQLVWYDMMKSVPIPIIEFKAPCIDANDIMFDFSDMFSKEMLAGGADVYKWSFKDPTLTAIKLARIQKLHEKIRKTKEKKK